MTSAVKNYQKSLRSQHLLKVGSSDHLDPGKKVSTLRYSEFKEMDLIIVSLPARGLLAHAVASRFKNLIFFFKLKKRTNNKT